MRVSALVGFEAVVAAFGAFFAVAAAFGSVLGISSCFFAEARLLVRRGGGGDIGRFSEEVGLDSFTATLASVFAEERAVSTSPWPIFLRFRCPSSAVTSTACFSDDSSGDGTAGVDSADFIAGGL